MYEQETRISAEEREVLMFLVRGTLLVLVWLMLKM